MFTNIMVPIFLVWLWYMVPEMDIKMTPVVGPLPCWWFVRKKVINPKPSYSLLHTIKLC